MERVVGGTRHQRRLIIDPKLLDALERVGNDNSLVLISI